MVSSIYGFNDDPQHFAVNYYDNGDPHRRLELEAQWQSFERSDPAMQQAYRLLFRQTSFETEVSVDHFLPLDTPAGRYRVETFIPGLHASTHRAVFTIGHDLLPDPRYEWELQEALVMVDMHNLYDVWHSLGEFSLDPARHRHIGRVRQYDLSHEEPPEEISFGPVRWIPLPDPGERVGFDAPVGSQEERDGIFPSGRYLFGHYPVWSGEWFDANPFLSWYRYGYHTGADLNLPGISSADRGKPVYAISDGLVTYAGRAGSWGNIVVVEHPQAVVTLPDGDVQIQPVYSRYGHVEDKILVRSSETVARGQQIASIGLASGAKTGWHLHFDISYSGILKNRPAHWPDLGDGRFKENSSKDHKASVMRQVIEHYLDPLKFIQDNHI